MLEVLLPWTVSALLVIAYALLALSQERHWEAVAGQDRPVAVPTRAQRMAASVAIVMSLLVCIEASGGGMVTLLWAFLNFAAAFAVSFCLTWRPRCLATLA